MITLSKYFVLDLIKDKKRLAYLSFISILAIIGIYMRLWWINNVPTTQMFDFATYQILAENIFNGKGHVLDGYPVAWQGSGYSYLLAFFYTLIGSTNEIYGKHLNVILSSFTLILSFFIYSKFFENKKYISIAFVITTFLPSLISYNNVLGTETFFLFLMACILVVQLYIPNKKFAYPLLGILCGISSLTKPYMLVYPFIIAIINWVDNRSFKKSLISFGLIMFSCIIVITPWSYRNYRLFGRLIPISYNSGYVLYINNNNTNTSGSWLDLTSVEAPDSVKLAIEDSLAGGAKSIKAAPDTEPILKSEAMNWIKKNPVEFLKLGILRLHSTFFSGANDISQWTMNGLTKDFTSTFWSEIQHERNMNVLSAFFDASIYILSSACFIFLLSNLKKYFMACFTLTHKIDFSTNLIFLNLAFSIVINFVFEGQARYVFPILIFMIAALAKIIEGLNRE